MNEEPETPKKRINFRKNSNENGKKIDFRATDDTRTVATKDGTTRTHKPPNVTTANAMTRSPMGSVAVNRSRDVSITVTSEDLPAYDIPVSMDRQDVDIDYENKGIRVLVRRDDEKSVMGIDGGHISRLTLAQGPIGDEEILAHYDKGEWLKEPDTFLAKQVTMEAKKQDNGITHASIRPAFAKAVDPDLDI